MANCYSLNPSVVGSMLKQVRGGFKTLIEENTSLNGV